MQILANILRLLLLVGLISYLGYSFVASGRWKGSNTCESLSICVSDSLTASFVTCAGLENRLYEKGLLPVGRLMDSINCQQIKDAILADHFVEEVTCYKTPARQVHVIVSQRVPILRVMADNGENYFIDRNGYKMAPEDYYADVPVVTGRITYKFLKNNLVDLGLLIRNDEFWSTQIEQIHVSPKQELLLTTRIGNFIINAGTPENMGKKLRNLYIFYSKVLNEVGWNQYSEINIAYENQVVCKKRK